MPIKSEHFIPRPKEPLHFALLDRCDSYAKQYPGKIAFMSSENHDDYITFAEVREYSLSIGSYLYSNGFKKGDVLLHVIPNCWELPISFLGGLVAGMTISGASVKFTRYELEYQIKDSEAAVIITDDTQLHKVLQASKGHHHVKVVCIRRSTKPLPVGATDFVDLISQPKGFNLRTVPINMDEDLIILPYSSGTTGTPKGVMITHANFAYALDTYQYVEGLKLRANGLDCGVWFGRIYLAILPQYHAFGFFSETQLKAESLALVPAIITQIANTPILDEYDLSSLQRINCGAAPLGKNICDKIKARLNVQIAQGYGMTEMTLGSHYAVVGQPEHAAGKVTANYEMKIVNTETEEELGPNQSGELRVKGPTIMKGYKNRPVETAQTFDNEGFLKTGDVGYYDEQGFLYISDRSKELIKVRGAQVAPAELENIILGLEGVVECAVVGIPHKAAGEVPRAFVVRRQQTPTAEQIEEHFAEKVAHYKRLAGGIVFISEIPRTPTGKILRRKLKYLEIQPKAKL